MARRTFIVPSSATMSLVATRDELTVLELRVTISAWRAKMLDALTFTGVKTKVVKFSMEAFVADKFVADMLSTLTVVVVYINVLAGALPSMLVMKLIIQYPDILDKVLKVL